MLVGEALQANFISNLRVAIKPPYINGDATLLQVSSFFMKLRYETCRLEQSCLGPCELYNDEKAFLVSSGNAYWPDSHLLGF